MTTPYLTPEDLSAHLTARGIRTSRASVLRALAAGQLPGRKLLGQWVITPEALERWESGLPTIWDPAFAAAFRALEAGLIKPIEQTKEIIPFVASRRSG